MRDKSRPCTIHRALPSELAARDSRVNPRHAALLHAVTFTGPHFDPTEELCQEFGKDCVPSRPGCVLREKSVFAVSVEEDPRGGRAPAHARRFAVAEKVGPCVADVMR